MVGETEQFIDMLFCNIALHAYVVIEVKVTEFEPRDIGQVTTYVAAVDGMLRGENDAPTIGLLICKTKDDVLAKCATAGIQLPVGISEYEMSKLWPENFRSTLPTIEEIENDLKGSYIQETKYIFNNRFTLTVLQTKIRFLTVRRRCCFFGILCLLLFIDRGSRFFVFMDLL